jgi:hypothetical protein
VLSDSPKIKPEYRAHWAKLLSSAGKFFKHARADPDATLEFNSQLNEMYLLFSIHGLNQMGETPAPEERAFIHWMFVNRPEILNEGAYNGFSVEQIEELRGVPKGEFLQRTLAAFRLKGRA